VKRHRLTINGRDYWLSPDLDAERLAGTMIAAARSGGDFVDIEIDGHNAVRELVTAASAIRLAYVERAEHSVSHGEPFDSFDYDGL